MWHAVFVEQIPLAEKVLRTVLVYVLVAVLIRATGKRALSGINTLDIVVMTLLSNVVQNSIIGDDLSFTGGAVGAVTLVAINAAVTGPPCRARCSPGSSTARSAAVDAA